MIVFPPTTAGASANWKCWRSASHRCLKQTTAARGHVHADIEALAAHLGLLHADAADPRLKLALDALPEHSPARAALADAQQRSRSTDTTDDLLQPGRAPAEGAQPSAADRRKLAELEAMLRNLPPKPADGSAEPAALLALRHFAEAKAAETRPRLRPACAQARRPSPRRCWASHT